MSENSNLKLKGFEMRFKYFIEELRLTNGELANPVDCGRIKLALERYYQIETEFDWDTISLRIPYTNQEVNHRIKQFIQGCISMLD